MQAKTSSFESKFQNRGGGCNLLRGVVTDLTSTGIGWKVSPNPARKRATSDSANFAILLNCNTRYFSGWRWFT